MACPAESDFSAPLCDSYSWQFLQVCEREVEEQFLPADGREDAEDMRGGTVQAPDSFQGCEWKLLREYRIKDRPGCDIRQAGFLTDIPVNDKGCEYSAEMVKVPAGCERKGAETDVAA